MANIYINFKRYTKHGIVPTDDRYDNEFPENSFYKSVHYIDSVLGPIKDVVLESVKAHTMVT